jgi:hypothetical protein
MPDPHAIYTERLAARRAARAGLDAAIDRLGQWRLGVFLIAAGAALVGLISGAFHPSWAALGLVPFILLVARTHGLDARRPAAIRAVQYYERGLDRLAGNWAGRGPTGARFAAADHLYAADLDLFGDGSLFQRIGAARTAAGEDRLAGWLLAPAGADEIRARQAAVADLRDRLDLREYLAGVGSDVNDAADLAPLAAWGNMPPQPVSDGRRRAVFALGWFNLLAVTGWIAFGTTSLPVFLGLVLSVLAVRPLYRGARDVARPIETAQNHLPLLAAILAHFEREPFAAPRLVALQAALAPDGGLPSERVRELHAIAEWVSARNNPFFFPIAIAMLWDVRMALLLDTWRRRSGPSVSRWLDAVAELDALGSLAGYAFENPRDPFPDVIEADDPRFEADALGHPLLPDDRSVRNDVRLGGTVRLLMVSGSNMSGKSTLLRSVGVNAVLALAGGPVRAARLTLSPATLGATMRVQDSLQEGRSRFYAEVTRVRAVLGRAAGRPPVMFLFDELFAGTNSADRLAGAEAVLRTLLDAGAVGFVTTHDLALTDLTARLGDRAVNVHFAEQWTRGEMSFDYRMTPGVVPHGNGLALMRAVGLDV